jgi:transposase
MGQREYNLREVFNGLRYVIKTGAPWRWKPLPSDVRRIGMLPIRPRSRPQRKR